MDKRRHTIFIGGNQTKSFSQSHYGNWSYCQKCKEVIKGGTELAPLGVFVQYCQKCKDELSQRPEVQKILKKKA
jgi:hypothetical protein